MPVPDHRQPLTSSSSDSAWMEQLEEWFDPVGLALLFVVALIGGGVGYCLRMVLE